MTLGSSTLLFLSVFEMIWIPLLRQIVVASGSVQTIFFLFIGFAPHINFWLLRLSLVFFSFKDVPHTFFSIPHTFVCGLHQEYVALTGASDFFFRFRVASDWSIFLSTIKITLNVFTLLLKQQLQGNFRPILNLEIYPEVWFVTYLLGGSVEIKNCMIPLSYFVW